MTREATRVRLRRFVRVAPLVVSLVIHVLLVGAALGVGLRPRSLPPAILAELVVIEPAPPEARPEPPRPRVEKRSAAPRLRAAAAPLAPPSPPVVAPRLLEPEPLPAVAPPPLPKPVAEEPAPAPPAVKPEPVIVANPVKPEPPRIEAPKPEVTASVPTVLRPPEHPAPPAASVPHPATPRAPSASSAPVTARSAPVDVAPRTEPGVSFVGPSDGPSAAARPAAAPTTTAPPGTAGAPSAPGSNVAAIPPGSGTGVSHAAAPRGGYQVRPSYPASARRLGIQGTTLLRVHVASDGRVTDVKVDQSAGHEDLDAAASDAVRRWRFEPGRRGDEAVAMWVLLPVEFRLK